MRIELIKVSQPAKERKLAFEEERRDSTRSMRIIQSSLEGLTLLGGNPRYLNGVGTRERLSQGAQFSEEEALL